MNLSLIPSMKDRQSAMSKIEKTLPNSDEYRVSTIKASSPTTDELIIPMAKPARAMGIIRP